MLLADVDLEPCWCALRGGVRRLLVATHIIKCFENNQQQHCACSVLVFIYRIFGAMGVAAFFLGPHPFFAPPRFRGGGGGEVKGNYRLVGLPTKMKNAREGNERAREQAIKRVGK